jgi:drug/metabolite transporter (DMT)-like permease
MSATIKCPKCGCENPASARYCASCGNGLATVPLPSNVPLRIPDYPGSFPFSTQPIDHALARLSVEQRKAVSRSRTGLFLIFIGIVFGSIPAVALYAGLSLIAGAVLIFVGRGALGPKHRRYAFWSFLAIIVGVFGTFVSSFVLGVLFALAIITGGDPVSVLSSLFLALNILLTVVGAIIGLGLVFLAYDLQNATGRALLWAAYSLGILVNVIILLVIVSQIQAASAQVLSQVGTPAEALVALENVFAPWRLLQFIPAFFYGVAYYKAWSRIEKKATQEPGITPG